MKKKNNTIPLICLVVIVLAAVGLVKHFDIKDFQTIQDESLYVSGQPRGMDYTRLLYKYHIATIVNLRSADEHRERNWYNEEVTWTRGNGVRLIELPIEKHGTVQGIPDKATVAKFLAIMADPTNLPVLVHGNSAERRVALLTAAWLLESGGYDFKQMRDRIQKINSQPITDEETEYLQSLVR